MKKITFTLLAAIGLIGTAFSQPIVSIQAPQYDGGSSSASIPSGSVDAVYHRSCYLILKSELTDFAFTNSVVTAWGIDFTQGVNVATVGQVTVSLQNTSDLTYTKGTNWPGVLTGMTTNYTGSYNLPVSNGFTNSSVPLSTSFLYGGGGIYVALEWYAPTAASTQWARAQCNTGGLPTVGGVRGYAPSVGPAPTTLSTSAYRPAFTFAAANTATNEISVLDMQSLGQVTKWAGLGEVITARIRNNSSVALTNVSVGLAVSGPNLFTNAQVVTSIGAGSIQTVSFLPFTSTANGLNSMTVSVLPDQDNSNNSATWTQSVTCNVVAITPYLAASNYTDNAYIAGTGGGILALKYKTGSAASNVVAVRCVVPSFTNAGNAGNTLSPVLCDASGAILSQGNPVTLTSSNMDVVTAFNFTAPIALTPNTDYYFGLASTTSTNGPFGFTNFNTLLVGHYRIPLAGGTPVLTDYDGLSISASLSFSATTITASAGTKTVVCKKDGPNTVTLTATGGSNSYAWTPGGPGASIAVTPTVAGTNGVVMYSVIGTETVSGCKSNIASVSVSVSACNGLADNNSNGYDLKLFPNPAVNGKSTITGLVGSNNIVVYNTLGQVVLSQVASNDTTTIDLSAYPAGNYMVKITNSSSESRIIKVVNQN